MTYRSIFGGGMVRLRLAWEGLPSLSLHNSKEVVGVMEEEGGEAVVRAKRAHSCGPRPSQWARIFPNPHRPKSPAQDRSGSSPVPARTGSRSWKRLKKFTTARTRKKPNWVESLGFKKDTLQLLTCLRRIRVNFRCFRSYPASDLTSDDEDDEDCKEEQVGVDEFEGNDNSKAAFSKWFMVLQEESREREKSESHNEGEEEEEVVVAECRPPPNALLLMRCRSAPAKSWLEERQREEENGKLGMGLEEIKRSDRSEVVMRYDTDFYKLSSDVAKETWVVGDLRDQLSRRRSWKR
ncbi:hypothetical protein Acr_21g0006400 [Actinidia rufa]|uniref:Uncharacterized protein n=1 Tax=Actinidia rufa TaxID=165716 RepID=A0A7J0GH41_9ERIC|nr:hypothetical protein Acr_21g0006400 [Actinidia rufa]